MMRMQVGLRRSRAALEEAVELARRIDEVRGDPEGPGARPEGPVTEELSRFPSSHEGPLGCLGATFGALTATAWESRKIAPAGF